MSSEIPDFIFCFVEKGKKNTGRSSAFVKLTIGNASYLTE